MPVFGQRVFHHAGEGHDFTGGGDDLKADRIAGIVRINQRCEVRGNIHPEQAPGGERFALAVGEVQDLLEVLNRIQAMAELPAPVVPFLRRNILVNRGAFGGEGER